MALDRDNISTDQRAIKSRTSNASVAHHGGVKSLQFLPDNQHLLTLGGDAQMYLWNIENGQRLLVNYGPIPTDKLRLVNITCAQMKHDRSKSLVYVPSGKTIRVHDVFSGQRLSSLSGHLMRVNTCTYNRLAVELYSCSDDILVWSAVQKEQDQYEITLRNQDRRSENTRSLGQILNRDQWSDDEGDN